MAVTVAVVVDRAEGNTRYIELLMTLAEATSEYAFDVNLPTRFTLVRFDVQLVSGAAATVNPAIGRAAAFTAGDFDEIGSDIAGAPAARVGTTAPLQIELREGNILYMQPRPDAGADNVVRVGLYIIDGWAL